MPCSLRFELVCYQSSDMNLKSDSLYKVNPINYIVFKGSQNTKTIGQYK